MGQRRFLRSAAGAPDLWNSGIAQSLVAAVSDQFERWGTPHAGPCTFPRSTKHSWVYQKTGFYPRFLTAIMAAPAAPSGLLSLPPEARYSTLSGFERSVYKGLDLRGETRTVAARGLSEKQTRLSVH